ncbi:MAG: Gfo/Idh/MocA family oxidoreductase [Actinomycetota bacterium]|nr:Gfo/Idh/MocA family oxidoreductase [Actinomycetota bacterium]
MRRLRAGVLGLGNMGRHHVRALGELSGVDLVAVADRDGDSFGAAKGTGLVVLRDLEEMLAVGIDMCVVALPTEDHAPAAMRLAECGVATLIEKPLAVDSVSGRQVVEAFATHGVVGCVGHIERYNPALQAMRQKITAGLLGTVYQIATRRQGPFPARVRDVGVIKDLATHDLDLSAWVASSRYELVSAQVAYQAGRVHEDLVAAIGRLESGAVTNHVVNWLSPVKERVVVVTGAGGSLEADTLRADLTFYENGSVPTTWDAVAAFRGVSEGDAIRYALAKPEPLATELAAFRDAVLGDPSGIVSLSDGLVTLGVAEALLRSATGQTAVSVQP